jgi:hypothetical protein
MNILNPIQTDDFIINQLNNSVDYKSTKKTVAFKYFQNNEELLDLYIRKNTVTNLKLVVSNPDPEQLEFSF